MASSAVERQKTLSAPRLVSDGSARRGRWTHVPNAPAAHVRCRDGSVDDQTFPPPTARRIDAGAPGRSAAQDPALANESDLGSRVGNGGGTQRPFFAKVDDPSKSAAFYDTFAHDVELPAVVREAMSFLTRIRRCTSGTGRSCPSPR